MDRILEQASRVAQEAEVYYASSEETPVNFDANRLKGMNTRMSSVVALRLVKDGRMGYSITNKTDDYQSLVNKAVEVSRFGAKASFTMPSGGKYPKVDIYDPEVAKGTSQEKMVDLGQSMIDAVRKHCPELFCGGRVYKSTSAVQILNSRGGEAKFERTSFALDFEGTLVRGTDMLFVYESDISSKVISDYKLLTDKVVQRLELAKQNVPIKSGKMPVIFTPNGFASVFLAPLITAFNGKMVLQKASKLSDKLGSKVFADVLSIADDSTVEFRPRSRPCDDEGVASQRTPLVEAGVVKAFLYDLQTAGLAGVRSTGNGSRMMGGLPSPAPTNLVIKPGKASFEDMVRDVKEGLLVELVIGAEQGNILAGDFGGNVLLGYKIEGGQIVGRVKDTMLSGNIYEALSRIVALENKASWASGVLETPAVLCADLSVASKS